MKVYPIIGMSPGNSYFKDAEVRYLLQETLNRYGQTAILIADIPAIATYVAYGYPENRARNKAVPKGNNLKNRTRRIAAELGMADKVRIIDWEQEVDTNQNYQEWYGKMRSLYDTIPAFAEVVEATTRSVLETSEKDIADLEAATKIAVHYLLSELAFLEFAPAFLQAEQVMYVYHRNWPVYERYVAGAFDGVAKPHLEFLLLENPHETYRMLGGEQMERITEEKVLRCSFSNYPPGFIENEDGTFGGIFYDLITNFAKEHGWQISWSEETGYGVIKDGLKAGRFDVFVAPTWPIPERLAGMALSLSVYQSEVGLWVREADLAAAKQPETLHNPFFRVAVKEGDITDSIASHDFQAWRKVRIPQLTDTEELLYFVSNGDADATFVEPFLVDQFNERSEVKLVDAADQPVRIFGNCFVLSEENTELKSLLDAYLKEKLADGMIQGLLEKYAPRYREQGISLT